LADEVLASGYQTKSRRFINVIWSRLGRMRNVEIVPDRGFRLREGKAAGKATKS